MMQYSVEPRTWNMDTFKNKDFYHLEETYLTNTKTIIGYRTSKFKNSF